jgi:hypothetical protein
VRVAQSEAHARSADLGAVADALDLELLAESLRHADDRVVQQRAGQPVERPLRLRIVAALDHDLPVGDSASMPPGSSCASEPFGPLTVTVRPATSTFTPR